MPRLFGIGACVLAGVQIIALILTFVLLCSNRDEYDGLKAQEQSIDRNGAELAGTGAAAYSRPTEYV